MSKRTSLLALGLATAALTNHAAADLSTQAAKSTRYAGYAQVIDVKPLVSRQMSSVPVKRCTWERVPSRVRYYPQRYERQVTERRAKRCRTSYESRVVENTTAYHVTLQYNGVTFTRRTDKHPGTRMPVTLEISPLNPRAQ